MNNSCYVYTQTFVEKNPLTNIREVMTNENRLAP